MPLTDVKIRATLPTGKGFRLTDGGGLHLYFTPTGVRSWRWRYEWQGRERTLVLGRYPGMGLANARRARDHARDRLQAGHDPSLPETANAMPTFEAAAHDWHHVNQPRWKPHHAADVLASLVAEVFPVFGHVPCDKVTPPMVLAVMLAMGKRGAHDTARRVRRRCAAVFAFADAPDPTARLLARMAPMPPGGHRPALLDLDEARALVRATDAQPGQPVTKLALRFLALTAARPGEVGGMRWAEVRDLDGPAPVWAVPGERMKMKRDHVVPLAHQAVDVLRVAYRLTGRGKLVFPNLRDARLPMSENAMGYFLIRLGYRGRHVPHGWRATFSTLMNERHPADRGVIDLMLAHLPKDKVEAAYNRAERMQRRRELAQTWADLLLEGAAPAATLLEGPRRTPA